MRSKRCAVQNQWITLRSQSKPKYSVQHCEFIKFWSVHVTCIHSSHPIFLFPVICFELPLTRTFFDFPRRFELSGVDCTSFVFSMSIAFSITPRFNQGEPDDGQKHGPHLVQRGNETWSSFSMPVSVTERAILSFLSRCLTSLLGKVTVEPLGTDTSLLRAVSNVPTKFSYIFF